MNLSRIVSLLVIFFLIFYSTACTKLNTKVGGMLDLDSDLRVSFLVEADVNPDDTEVPSPLIVRMYELKSPKTFQKANFIDLYEKDDEVLGVDLVGRQTLKHMQPGENRTSHFVLNKETEYVGLFAEFLKYKEAKYKVVIPIAKTNVFSSTAKVRLFENQLILVSERDGKAIQKDPDTLGH